MLSRSFEVYLAIALLTGLTAGHYFAPFQVMMGHVRPFHTLAWTIAFYNISWGSGYTLGPLVSGFAGTTVLAGESRASQMLSILLLVWALAVLHTVLALAARSAPRGAADPAGKTIAFSSTGRMRISGYVAAGMVTLVLSGVLATLWPNLGAARGLTDRQIALGGALLAAPTPLLAMAWARLRYHMMRPWMLMAIMILGAAAVLAVPATVGWTTHLCLLCIGISLSGSVFHGIYYCNADPNAAARAVTLYEAVIGAANFVGPVLLGMTAWTDRASARPYVLGSLLLIGATVAVGWIRRTEPSVDAEAPVP
jgi:F0F1-type ATP synthase assembly protein I